VRLKCFASAKKPLKGAGIPFPPSLGQSRITTNAGSSDIEEKSEETFLYGKQQ
jgi:hypothetical protein